MPGRDSTSFEWADLEDGRIVRELDGGEVFVFGSGTNLLYGHCTHNLILVIDFINNRCTEWLLLRDGLLADAGGVDLSGRGVAMSRIDGSETSTLTRQMMRFADCGFVSEERRILRKIQESITITDIPKLPRKKGPECPKDESLQPGDPPGRSRGYRSGWGDKVWQMEQDFDLPSVDVYGESRFALSSGLAGIVFLSWRRDDLPLRIEEISWAIEPIC